MRVRAAALLLVVAGAIAAPPSGAGTLRRPDGTPVRWSDLTAGRPHLVVFTTLWCDVCRREAPRVARWADEHREAVGTIVVVSGSEPARVAKATAERHLGAPVEAVVDADGALADAFDVRATPTLVLLDAAGDTRARCRRIDEVDLRGVAPPVAGEAAPDPLVAVSDTGQELATTYDVTVVVPEASRARAEADLASAREVCRSLGRQLSEWSDDSEVSRVNRDAADRAVPVSDALARILAGADHVARLTDGAFDVTWRPLGRLWDEAEARGAVPAPEEVRRTLESIGPDNVRVEDGTVRFRNADTQVGVAGVAKGWIIDAVFLHLRGLGYEHVLVNIGGDLRASGRDATGAANRIALRDPYRTDAVAGTLVVGDTAIATSGNYLRMRRIGGRSVGHILDPRTGYPPEFDGSATVFAPDAAMADALATAMFVLGPEDGLALARKLDGIDVVFVTREGLLSSAAEGVVERAPDAVTAPGAPPASPGPARRGARSGP